MGIGVLTDGECVEALTVGLRMSGSPRPEALAAASVRRAASLMCPTTPSALVGAVLSALQPIGSVDADSLVETVDTLVASGDLAEVLQQRGAQRRRLLYLGPPRFVRRRSGDLLLFGTRPDDAPLVGEALAERVRISGHLRRIDQADGRVFELLETYGVEEVAESKWMGLPKRTSARTLLSEYHRKLWQTSSSGPIEELRVLDPGTSPSYYRTRWRPAQISDDGIFLARRSQGYGSDLWCLVELCEGEHRRLLDLPTSLGVRGCDEGWQLQAAIDAANGRPQKVTVSGTGAGRVQLGLPSPPPRWLQRRWDLIGRRVAGTSSLVTYEISSRDTRDEVALVCDHLWMQRRVRRPNKGNTST